MKKQNKYFFIILAIFLGALWAYSFSTRINLLFIVPLGLKVIVLGGLGLNFAILAALAIKAYRAWPAKGSLKRWLPLAAIILTALVFLLAPYHSVPFRTTHTLKITAQDAEVKLAAVYSPDDNLVPRDEFEPGEGVTYFDAYGFRLTPGSTLNYQRGQTGGLTLSFTPDSGPANITWDGDVRQIDPGAVQNDRSVRSDGWVTQTDLETGRTHLSLPGYTWGNPDLFWSILGALLPVADFLTLASLLLMALWVILGLIQKTLKPSLNRTWLKAWLDALIALGLAMVLINVGFPDFIPGWFLLFFLPAMGMLAVRQVDIASQVFQLELACSLQAKKAYDDVINFLRRLNESRWTFWIFVGLIALAAAGAQLQLTTTGMGISGDSVHYIEGTRHIAAGDGYVRQIAEGDPVVMTGFPPVYSISLLPGAWFNIGIETFARYQNTALLILTILLSGLIVFKATGKAMPAIWTASFLALSEPILYIYTWIMSEPLFLVILLACFLLTYWQIRKPSLWKALLVGLVAGIMVNARLAGIAFVPVFALGILIYQDGRFGRRLRDAVLLAVAALIQPAAFFIRNSLVAGRVSESRGLTMATFKADYWETIGREMTSWFKWKTYFNLEYQRFNALFVTLGVILLLVLFWLIFRKKLATARGYDPIITLLFISIPVYLAVIVLNTVLFTPIQTVSGLNRYMIPVMMILWILLGKVLSAYWQLRLLFPKLMILFFLLVGISLYYPDAIDTIESPADYALHYTDRKTECGAELNALMAELPDTHFLTNNCEYFFFMTGKLCQHLSLDANAYLEDGVVTQALREGGIIAYTWGFGSNPPGISDYLTELNPLGEACFLNFYSEPGIIKMD
ncbi:MAG: hypothetical protein SVR81_00460 [Chloroflexota bacterium]|nr:hypothetical protein [Chloroflexota bacterium]